MRSMVDNHNNIIKQNKLKKKKLEKNIAKF